MKQKIYRSLCLTALVTLVISTLASLFVYFDFFDRREDESLMMQAEALTIGVDEIITGVSANEQQQISSFLLSYREQAAEDGGQGVRCTLVRASDGTVLFDTDKSAAEMESHQDRVEVVAAEKNGRGQATRTSRTIGRNTHYAAVLTADGVYVVRLARETSNIVGLFFRTLPLLFIIIVAVFLLQTLLSEQLTRQIVQPLQAIAAEIKDTGTISVDKDKHPMVYDELWPFLDAIGESERVRSEFSANVSHELKTPLTSISGFAELMKDGYVNDAAHVREFSTTIYNEAKRLLSLIDDIMHLSRIEAGTEDTKLRENVELHSLASEVLERLSDKAAKYEIELSLSGDTLKVYGNRTMLEELLYNLTDNAIKYNQPGGHVYVILEDNAVTVQDDGIGIPEASLHRVFERFYRVDKSHSRAIGGTGLGLSIVKHVAEKHHAEISIRSDLGRGTSISIHFPENQDAGNAAGAGESDDGTGIST